MTGLPAATKSAWTLFCQNWQPADYRLDHNRIVIEAGSRHGVTISRSMYPDRFDLVNYGDENSSSGRFFIYMSNQPHWLETPSGQSIEVPAHEVALLDSSSPLAIKASGPSDCIALVVDQQLLFEHFRHAGEICGQRLALPPALADIARSTLHAIWLSFCADQLDSVGDKLTSSLFAVLAVLDGVSDDRKAPRQLSNALDVRQAQIRDCIRKNFQSQDFNVSSMAAILGLSPRYLQRACASGELSPGEQLRRYRLQVAADRLRNSAWQNASIAEVCYSCGFGGSSYFATEFRKSFGISPREYRTMSMI
jgi:AraC-like DNA-binding protein